LFSSDDADDKKGSKDAEFEVELEDDYEGSDRARDDSEVLSGGVQSEETGLRRHAFEEEDELEECVVEAVFFCVSKFLACCLFLKLLFYFFFLKLDFGIFPTF